MWFFKWYQVFMKYDRAFIVRNEVSRPLLKSVDLYDDSHYWLFHSEESFHGEYDHEFFYFKDQRIDKRLKLPLNCVLLEGIEID